MSEQENDPPAPAVSETTRRIMREIGDAHQMGNVRNSATVPCGNGVWELRVQLTDGTTRRVRVDEDGAVSSDTTGTTKTLM